MAEQPSRQVAYKVSISTLINGDYVREEGWEPNYVICQNGVRVSRVNLMATAVSIDSDQQFSVDDGTATITVRSFQDEPKISELDVGDIVKIIGRPREFNNEKYIVPEIIIKIEDPRWIEIWRKEKLLFQKNIKLITPEESTGKSDPGNEGKVADSKPDQEYASNPLAKVYKIIKQLDRGEGAELSEIVKAAKLENTEEILHTLLQEGEIFELKPGRLKVLE